MSLLVMVKVKNAQKKVTDTVSKIKSGRLYLKVM